jgi:hypothetical protein
MNLKLNTNNDLLISENNIQLVNSIDEIQQRVYNNLKTVQGDCFLNLELGVPYYQDVLQKGIDLKVLGTIFKNAILDTEGVTTITKFILDYDNTKRQLNLDFTFVAENETITVQESF